MAIQTVELDEHYILNQCTKFLARKNTDPRHNFGQFQNNDRRSQISESWRFPIIDSYSNGVNFEGNYAFNQVTFVYQQLTATPPNSVAVIGTFAHLWRC